MLDIPGQPYIDKARLLGGCVRLPLRLDVERLRADVAAIPADYWGSQGGRVGVHTHAEAVFLRGYAPAEGDKPVEDREALSFTPYIRSLIHQQIPAPPLRCLMAKLKPAAYVGVHVDQAPYFGKALRLHFPVETNPLALMVCAGQVYHMAAGEAWALNNSTMHGVLNEDPHQARLHIICDFLPTDALIQLILAGDRHLGRVDPSIEERLQTHSQQMRG